MGYITSSLRLRPVSGEIPRSKLVIPVKLAPMATREAVPTPNMIRRWKVDANGANCSAGDHCLWLPEAKKWHWFGRAILVVFNYL
ncbi:hypothetical protein KSS87_011816, partial [Heliosperma pusillum]